MGEGSQLCRSFCPRDSKGQGARMVRPRSKWKGLQFFLKRNWRGRPTWGHSQSLHLLTFKNEAPFTEEMSSLLHLSRRDMCRWNTKCFLLILHLILVTGGNNALSWEKKVPILTQNMLGEVYKERLSTPERLICKILLITFLNFFKDPVLLRNQIQYIFTAFLRGCFGRWCFL